MDVLKKLFFVGCFLFISKIDNAQQIAFPGAEGAGKFTTGGRGTPSSPTTVYEVTNLNDDNSVGSLRYALSRNVAYRTIVFRVSGTIHLNSRLVIRGNTTVAGQTAPGDGICLADYPVAISGDNVIVRYIRCRMGDKNQNKGMVDGSGGDDSFGNLGGKNIIIDHCTSGWSSDESLTVYRGDSVSIQWCFIAEPLNYSYHFETGDADFERHGYGGIWGSRHGSFHHNLIAHCKGRLPRFAGSSTYPPGTAGQENADFRNNIIYDWISYSTNGGEGGNYNVVNNYYKYGPSTSTGNSSGIPVRSEIMNPSKSATLPYPKVFLSGNYVDGYSVATANNWRGIAMSSGSLTDTIQSKVTTPFSILPIVDQSAEEAYDLVLKFSGSSLPNRDTLDERIANDVRNRTGRVIDVQGGYPHGTPYEQTVNAWPTLQSSQAPTDSDHDGMPDQWETDHELNPNNSVDRSAIAIDGYTNLENYLNSLANDAMDIKASFTNFSQALGSASPVQTYSINGSHLTGNIVITPPAGYQLSTDGGSTWSAVGNPVTLNQSNGSIATKTISVRLNATTAGSYGGSIQHLVNGSEVSIALDGIASATTPVRDIGLMDSVNIYPNPASREIVVSYPRTSGKSSIEIISIDGKKLAQKNVLPGSTQTIMDTSHLSEGLYTIRYINSRSVVSKNFTRVF